MTADEIVLRALRRLGVAAHDEPATAEQMALGRQVLDDLFNEFTSFIDVTWTLADIPAAAAHPLAATVAIDLAPMMGVPAVEQRMSAFTRLCAVIRPDTRDDEDYEPDTVYY